jgi:hypothetical protein
MQVYSLTSRILRAHVADFSLRSRVSEGKKPHEKIIAPIPCPSRVSVA